LSPVYCDEGECLLIYVIFVGIKVFY